MASFLAMSNGAILKLLGDRLKQERLNQNLTQASLAERAGVSIALIKSVEGGSGCSLGNFIKLLRPLNKLDNLDLFLPEPGISPIELARLSGRERKEATGGRGRPSHKTR